MRTFYVTTFLSLLATVSAADWSVPSTWRKTTTSRDLTERTNLAQDALTKMQSWYNSGTSEYSGIGYWQSANAVSGLALKDLWAGTTTNKALVTSALAKIWSLHDHFYANAWNDDALWWGTASLYAYRAYKDNNFLTMAKGNWDAATPFVITPANAASNSFPKKGITIKGACSGATMAGGVFWKTDADININVITTSLYMTLSAYLAEITGDAKYKSAAELSAKFIKNQLYDSGSFLALDTIKPTDCSVTKWYFTYNSGKFIEGLSVLAQVTGNNDYHVWMEQTLLASIKSTRWEGSDGIITEGQGTPQNKNDDGRGFKAVFIRGLVEARRRNQSNTSLMQLVRAYVNVQYNALLDLARSGSSYGVIWHGPFEAAYSHGQLAVLDVIAGAVSVNHT